jgi:hypothetical protein
MIKTTTRNLPIGGVIVIDGKQRVITAKSKAFKAPEWFITYTDGDNWITHNFNSNKKWDVLDLVF